MATVGSSISSEQAAMNARYYGALKKASAAGASASPVTSAPGVGVGSVSGSERDILIRTVIGEAANEGQLGWAAVAHVIRNRTADTRFPGSAKAVSLQNKQFSAWNSGAGGNHLVNKYKPGDKIYDAVGKVVDGVFSGGIADPTGGATYYYSPAGMQALVSQGSQSNLTPRWWSAQVAAAGGNSVTIGGHKFAGKTNRSPTNTQLVGGVKIPNLGVGTQESGELRFDSIKKKSEEYIVKPASMWTPEEAILYENEGVLPEIKVNPEHPDLTLPGIPTMSSVVSGQHAKEGLFAGFTSPASGSSAGGNSLLPVTQAGQITGSSSKFIYDAHARIQSAVAGEL